MKSKTTILAAVLAAAALLAGLMTAEQNAQASSNEPNIVLLLTDDQTLDEMRALPKTQALIGGAGVTFSRAYASYPLCCPSRVSILTGQYMHNHNVRGNELPRGGWGRFTTDGTETKALPTWLKDAGYYNVEIGKYMNGYLGDDTLPVPPGWDEWYGKLSEYDPFLVGGSIYFNYRLREEGPLTGGVPCPGGNPATPPGEPFTCFYDSQPQNYQTDVLGEKTVNAIERLGGPGSPDKPFFLAVNFNAPHSPYVPAPRHDGAFAGAALQKVAALNEKNVRDKPRFLRRLPKLGNGKLNQINERRRARLEMLLSVDDQVERIMNTLVSEKELDNTYVIFLSDNGYFGGEHRIRQGKYLPHEPSSHIPMMIRGPGIPAGQTSSTLVSNVDVGTTIADIANANPTLQQDGRSILPYAAVPSQGSTRPIVLEGDTGASIDDDGTETAAPPLDAADQKRLKRFYKKLRKQKRRVRLRCKALKQVSKKRAQVCVQRGVDNLEQEPTDAAYKLRAPAYTGLRTDRYALFLYSTGELELYDMKKDPRQMESVHRDRRYALVRQFLLAKLNEYRSCQGGACSLDIGPDPKPLKKRKAKKRKKPPAKEPRQPKP